MGVLRRVIFPVLRIAIWAVIASALVVIAFKPGSASPNESDQSEPWADFTPSLITPIRGDVTNVVTLSGTVVPDTSREVTTKVSGTVHQAWVGDGEEVDNGAPLITVKTLLGDGDDENLFKTTSVWSNASGVVTMTVNLGDEVTAGDVVAKVFPGSFIVEADVEPLQMYQLVNSPSTAQATITGGPDGFTCKTFTTRVVMDEDGSSTRATCFVPSEAVVFPGLTASLELVTDSAEDVLLLPVTAVEGTVGTGRVWQYSDSGELTELEVGLGLSDGRFVEITTGLSDTDEVLEFVPSVDGPDWSGYEEDWNEEEFFEEEVESDEG